MSGNNTVDRNVVVVYTGSSATGLTSAGTGTGFKATSGSGEIALSLQEVTQQKKSSFFSYKTLGIALAVVLLSAFFAITSPASAAIVLPLMLLLLPKIIMMKDLDTLVMDYKERNPITIELDLSKTPPVVGDGGVGS